VKTILPLLLLAATSAFAGPAATAAPAACPEVAEQLSEYLASAKQRVGRDGEMRVEFDVDGEGRAQLVSMEGTRQYRAPVRIALETLDCRAGAPQRYVLNIRFVDPMPLAVAAAAPATVAQAASREAR